jgi:enoyl-CoA hydratase/carnithine racemase
MNVRLEITGHVATVTITRPQALNAVNAATRDELLAIWSDLEQNPDVRVIILTGEGDRAFSVGSDLKDSTESGLEYWAHATPGGFGGIALRETLNIPVIARVNGYALGGGFEMVLGADIVVAVEDAKFGLPEPRVGNIPLDGGAVLLHRQIPYRHAMGILLTGRHVPAAEALAVGLINEVVPRAQLDEAVARWVQAILACAPTSLRAIKQCARLTTTLSPTQAQQARLPALIEALQSENAKEGPQAFREKRPPIWTSR